MFKITERGLAVAGEAIEGTICIGDHIQSFGAAWPDGLRIEGIEYVRLGPAKRAALGKPELPALLFKTLEVGAFEQFLSEDRVLVLRASPPTDVSF